MMQRLGAAAAALFAAVVLAAASTAPAAAAFPDRPVRIIVPYAPGGGNDTLARVLGQKLEEQWGKPVIIENKSGGNTIIATDYVAKSPPDGYNILMVTPVIAVNPSLVDKLPYDTLRALTPVIMAGTSPNVLVAKPAVPANSVQEFIAYARANPGKLTYGSPGVGTIPHLAAALFNHDAKIDAVGVSFRGTQPALIALLAGDIDYMFDVTGSLEHVRTGRLKGLAVSVSKRVEEFPDIPTLQEAGLPGYEAYTWFGFLVTAGTPADVVTTINEGMNKAISDPGVRARIKAIGINLAGGTPQEFDRLIRAETEKWADVIRKTGIKQNMNR